MSEAFLPEDKNIKTFKTSEKWTHCNWSASSSKFHGKLQPFQCFWPKTTLSCLHVETHKFKTGTTQYVCMSCGQQICRVRDTYMCCRQDLSETLFVFPQMLLTPTTQKKPNHTNTWSHQVPTKIWRIANHKRDRAKRRNILQMPSCDSPYGQSCHLQEVRQEKNRKKQ